MQRTANRKVLLSQSEVHVDGGFHFHRLTIEVIGLVLPFLYRCQRRVGQHRMPADHVQVLDGTVLADQGLQHYRALNSGLLRQRRVLRRHLVNQQSLRHALGHANTLWRRGLGNGGGHAAHYAAQNSTHGPARYATGNATDYSGWASAWWGLILFDHLDFLRD